jgi:hypothetical protein
VAVYVRPQGGPCAPHLCMYHRPPRQLDSFYLVMHPSEALLLDQLFPTPAIAALFV